MNVTAGAASRWIELPIFAGLDTQVLADVASVADVCTVSRGERIFSHADESRRFYVVIEGRVQLLLPHGDRLDQHHSSHRLLGILGPGMSFGQAAAVLGLPHAVSARAAEACTLLAIDATHLDTMLQRHPTLAIRLLEETSRRLHEVVGDVCRYTQDSASQRLARYLEALVEQNADRAGPIRWPGRKSDIASHLAITPETLSRELGRLKAAGILSEDHGALRVHDAARLRQWSLSPTPAPERLQDATAWGS